MLNLADVYTLIGDDKVELWHGPTGIRVFYTLPTSYEEGIVRRKNALSRLSDKIKQQHLSAPSLDPEIYPPDSAQAIQVAILQKRKEHQDRINAEARLPIDD